MSKGEIGLAVVLFLIAFPFVCVVVMAAVGAGREE